MFMAVTSALAQCEVIDMVINEARQAVNSGDSTYAINLLQRTIDSQTIRDLNCSNFSRLTEEKHRIESQLSSSSLSSFGSSSFIGQNIPVTVSGVTYTMVAVRGGTFQMGATSEQGSDTKEDESPVHRVTLSDYYIGQTEVTQALWKAIMGSNPSRKKGSDLPVENVSWNDCQQFITKLNALTEGMRPNGRKFRLPTEAEWEYAARGGSKSLGYKYSGSNNNGSVAWYTGNSGEKTHPVGQKQANELGLYDMSGNVKEWCQDCYDSDYYGKSPSTNPCNNTSITPCVYRGGGWLSFNESCRVSIRSYLGPGDANPYIGLRLAM